MFVDSHTHLLRLEVSPGEAMEAAFAEGVEAVVNIGTTVEDSKRGAELAAALPGVYSAVGIHPHNAGDYTPGDLDTLAAISESPGVVALGEVGIDYHRNEHPEDVQKALFADAIYLANDLRLPVVIHARAAFEDAMECLKNAEVPVVLHCFEGGENEIRAAAERDYYIGLAGNVTYNGSATAPYLALIDPDRMLVETDAPYLSPQPVRRERNQPKNVVHTAAFVAGALGMETEELGEITARNAARFYGLPLGNLENPESPDSPPA
jgi:TatD DNase family protein